MKLRIFLLTLLASVCLADSEPRELTNDPSDNTPSAVRDSFNDAYRAVVQAAIQANLADNTATNPDYWANSRDFCFSTKPSRPTDAEAARIAATPGIKRAPAPQGVGGKLPIYEAESPNAAAQVKRLHDTMAAMKAKSKLTTDDVVEMMDAALPFMRTLEAGSLAKKITVTVPPKSSVTYAYTPHCLQVDAPAVGVQTGNRVHRAVGANQPVGFYPVSVLIPKEAQEIYSAVLNYESTHPESRMLVHTLLWGIRGADLKPPPINPTPAQINLLNAALPDGAKKYAAYVEIAQHPNQGTGAACEGPSSPTDGLLTIDSTKSDLLRHHLDAVTINHGGANPFNPADTETILKQLTDPGPIPVFEAQPQDLTVQDGSTAKFTATVTGPDVTYQWMFNGKNLQGATTTTLSVQASKSTTGIYQLVASNSAATVKSRLARLALGDAVAAQKQAPITKKTSAPQPLDLGNKDDLDPFHSDPSALNEPLSTTTTLGEGISSGIGAPAPNPNPGPAPASTNGDPGQGPYSLIAPGVCGTGVQDGLDTGKVTITNSNDTPYQFVPTDYIVATKGPSQPSPINPENLSTPVYPSDKSMQDAENEINQFFGEFKSLADSGALNVLSPSSPFLKEFGSTVLEVGVRSLPIIGSAISVWEAATITDFFSGEHLTPIKEAEACLGAVTGLVGFGGAVHDAKAAWQILTLVGDDSRVLNSISFATAGGLQTAEKFGDLGIVKGVDYALTGADLGGALDSACDGDEQATLHKFADIGKDKLAGEINDNLAARLARRLRPGP